MGISKVQIPEVKPFPLVCIPLRDRLPMALLSQGWPYSHLCMRIFSPTVELLFQESTYSVSLITKDHYNSICPFNIFPCNSQPQSIPTVRKTEGLL